MFLAPRSTPLRLLALAGLAAAAALLSNALAPPSRRLAWSGLRGLMPPTSPRIEPPPSPESAHQAQTIPEARPERHPQTDLPSVPGKPTAPVFSDPAEPKETSAPSPIREIGLEEAWEAFQSGVPFLDARRSSAFVEGHVARAWCAPVWESDLEDRLFQFKAARRPGPDDPIVIYCSGGDCRDSHLLAEKLLNEGYNRLLIFREGFPEWAAKGHPVEKGQS